MSSSLIIRSSKRVGQYVASVTSRDRLADVAVPGGEFSFTSLLAFDPAENTGEEFIPDGHRPDGVG